MRRLHYRLLPSRHTLYLSLVLALSRYVSRLVCERVSEGERKRRREEGEEGGGGGGVKDCYTCGQEEPQFPF